MTFNCASNTNTVTFRSESGDPAGTTVYHDATGAGDNYVVRFWGGDHIRIEDLTLASNDVPGSTYGRVIGFTGGSDSIRIENNILSGTPTTGTSTNQTVIVDGGNRLVVILHTFIPISFRAVVINRIE